MKTYMPVPAEQVNELRLQQSPGLIDLSEEPMPDEDFRATEMAWLSKHSDELSTKHPGEWVAIEGESLIGHGRELADVMRQAAETGHAHPFVTLVPSGTPKPLFAVACRPR